MEIVLKIGMNLGYISGDAHVEQFQPLSQKLVCGVTLSVSAVAFGIELFHKSGVMVPNLTQKEKKMKKVVAVALLVFALLLNAGILFAEGSTNESVGNQEMQKQRKDLQDMKKLIVSANMQLTEAEAVKFWPVYDDYTRETMRVNDTKMALIDDYARSYDTLTDVQAQSLTRRMLAADDAVVQLRFKYFPIFSRVLPVKKSALFMQLDRRLGLMMDMELVKQIPMVQP